MDGQDEQDYFESISVRLDQTILNILFILFKKLSASPHPGGKNLLRLVFEEFEKSFAVVPA